MVHDSFGGSPGVTRKLRAFAYFEPTKGETSSSFPLSCRFDVFERDGKLVRRVLLEMDPVTSRMTGKSLYFLDENHWVNGKIVFHASYASFKEDPGYAKIRQMAVEVIEGKKKWRFASGRPSDLYKMEENAGKKEDRPDTPRGEGKRGSDGGTKKLKNEW
ncbi:MAG: hypothetical protein N3A38_06385 [Planctomycetota bacterium]|nr:hypothetical protein [Planctomycetota bacterium]